VDVVHLKPIGGRRDRFFTATAAAERAAIEHWHNGLDGPQWAAQAAAAMDAVWVGQKLLDAVVSRELREAVYTFTDALQFVSWNDPSEVAANDEAMVWDFLEPSREALHAAVTRHFAAFTGR
jgi:hypothetical protein